MAKRKYNEYLINVTFEDGSTDEIEYTRDDQVDTSSYKQMLQVYRDTKKEYADKDCQIDFIGTNEDEKVVIYSKIFKVEDEEDIDVHISICESLNVITHEFDKILSKKDIISKRTSDCDTKINISYHADFEDCGDFDDEYKIEKFDYMRRLLEERRNLKGVNLDFAIIETDLKEVISLINKMKKSMDKKAKTSENIKEKIANASDDITILNKRVCKYDNFKQRMNLMKQLQPKYKTIINDAENSRLICSNKKR